MPKIRKPPPRGILDYLIERYRDGRISAADFIELKRWLRHANLGCLLRVRFTSGYATIRELSRQPIARKDCYRTFLLAADE
jgi:hypothetical protein